MATFGNMEKISEKQVKALQMHVNPEGITVIGQGDVDVDVWHSVAPGKWTWQGMPGIESHPQVFMNDGKLTFMGKSAGGLQYAVLDPVKCTWSDLDSVKTDSAPDLDTVKVLSSPTGSAQLLGLAADKLMIVGEPEMLVGRVIARELPVGKTVMDGAITRSGRPAVTFSDGSKVWLSVAPAGADHATPLTLADYTGQTASVDFVKTATPLGGGVVSYWAAWDSALAGQITLGRAGIDSNGCLTREPVTQTIVDVLPGSVSVHTDASGNARACWIHVKTGFPNTLTSTGAGVWNASETVAPIAVRQLATAGNANGDVFVGLVDKLGAVHAATRFAKVGKWELTTTPLSVDASGTIAAGIDDVGNTGLVIADTAGARLVRGKII